MLTTYEASYLSLIYDFDFGIDCLSQILPKGAHVRVTQLSVSFYMSAVTSLGQGITDQIEATFSCLFGEPSSLGKCLLIKLPISFVSVLYCDSLFLFELLLEFPHMGASTTLPKRTDMLSYLYYWKWFKLLFHITHSNRVWFTSSTRQFLHSGIGAMATCHSVMAFSNICGTNANVNAIHV